MWKFIFGLMLLAGCQSMSAASDARFDSYAAEREAYYRCGINSGKQISAKYRHEDPYYIALAAKQQCAVERNAMINGIMAAHSSATWVPIIRTFDEGFEETVISSVLRG